MVCLGYAVVQALTLVTGLTEAGFHKRPYTIDVNLTWQALVVVKARLHGSMALHDTAQSAYDVVLVKTPFSNLPDELLLRVLYYLDIPELLSTSRVGIPSMPAPGLQRSADQHD